MKEDTFVHNCKGYRVTEMDVNGQPVFLVEVGVVESHDGRGGSRRYHYRLLSGKAKENILAVYRKEFSI